MLLAYGGSGPDPIARYTYSGKHVTKKANVDFASSVFYCTRSGWCKATSRVAQNKSRGAEREIKRRGKLAS